MVAPGQTGCVYAGGRKPRAVSAGTPLDRLASRPFKSLRGSGRATTDGSFHQLQLRTDPA